VGSSLYTEPHLQQRQYLHDRAGRLCLGGLHARIQTSDHIDARLNLNNAFDKKYYNSLSSSVTLPSNVYGDPRNLRLSVKYRF
jgi:outer membrane receptor for ferric coprogen and ferric-rhodotorulic acid